MSLGGVSMLKFQGIGDLGAWFERASAILGSTPRIKFDRSLRFFNYGPLAQSVEQIPFKDWVPRSIRGRLTFSYIARRPLAFESRL